MHTIAFIEPHATQSITVIPHTKTALIRMRSHFFPFVIFIQETKFSNPVYQIDDSLQTH